MPFSLTPAQQKLMAIIKREAGRRNRNMPIRDMAAELGVSPSRIVQRLKNLKTRGHIIQYKGNIWPIFYGETHGKRN